MLPFWFSEASNCLFILDFHKLDLTLVAKKNPDTLKA